jgi:hypothetical protein
LKKNLKVDLKTVAVSYNNPSTASNSSVNTFQLKTPFNQIINCNTLYNPTKPSFDIETEEHLTKEVKLVIIF